MDILTDNLSEIEEMYSSIYPKIANLNIKIIPNNYKSIFSTWQSQNDNIKYYLHDLNSSLAWFKNLIGKSNPRRYLLVFLK